MKKIFGLLLACLALPVSAQSIPQSNLQSCRINAQTGTSYTLVLSDANNCVTTNNALANTVTIPAHASVPFQVGNRITIQQVGTGQTTITPDVGVTFDFSPSTEALTPGVQWGLITLRQTATDTWSLDNTSSAQQTQLFTYYEAQQGGSGHCGQGTSFWSCTTAIPNIAVYPLGNASGNAKDLLLAAGGGTVTGLTSLKGNGYATDLYLGANGDAGFYFGVNNPIFHVAMGDNSTGGRGMTVRIENSASPIANNSIQFGITTQAATVCPSSLVSSGANLLPLNINGPCTYWFAPTDGANKYPMVIATQGTISVESWYLTNNLVFSAVGNVTPVKWVNVTSTGTSQATVNLGDTTGTASIVYTQGPAPTIVSGFGVGASIVSNSGCYAFTVNIGTGGVASNGVVGCPTANNSWNCGVHDITTPATNLTDETAIGASSITVTNFVRTTGVAGPWTASDQLVFNCSPQ
jgi:hypothetical protein